MKREVKGKFEVKGTPAEASSVIKELGVIHMKGGWPLKL